MELSFISILLFAIVGAAAFTQGFTGLGFSIICMTGLSLLPVDLERISAIVNLFTLALTGTLVFIGRKKSRIDWRLTADIFFGMVFGVPIGYLFILYFGNTPVFRFCFGSALLLLAANQFYRPDVKLKKHRLSSVTIGVIGGFLNGAFTASGPITAWYLYSQSKDTNSNKSILQILIFSATLWRLINIFLFGEGITQSMMTLTAVGLAIVAVSAVLGHMASGRVSLKTFLMCVYIVIGISGLVNIVKALN